MDQTKPAHGAVNMDWLMLLSNVHQGALLCSTGMLLGARIWVLQIETTQIPDGWQALQIHQLRSWSSWTKLCFDPGQALIRWSWTSTTIFLRRMLCRCQSRSLCQKLCIVCTASHDISWIFSKICFATQNSLQWARLGDKTLWTCAGYSGTWWCQRCGQSCLMLSLLFRTVSSMSKVCQSLSCMWIVQKIHFGLWASWQQDPGAEAQLEPQGLWVSGVTVFDIAVDEDVNCQESRERSCSANLHVTNTKPRLDQRHTQGIQIKQLSMALFWRCGAKNSRRSLSMLSLWFLAVHAIGWFLSTQVLDLAASGTRCLMHVWFAVYPPVFSSIWQDLGKTEGASRTEQPSS